MAPKADPRSYLRPLRRWWWLIVAIVVPVTVGTYLYYDHKPKVYTASTELYVESSSKLEQVLFGASGFTDASTVNNLALLVGTTPVAQQASKELKRIAKRVPGGADITGGVSAAPVGESTFFEISASSNSPLGAAVLANTYAKAFIAIQDQQLQRQVKQAAASADKQLKEIPAGPANEARRVAIEERLQSLHLVSAIPGDSTGISQVQKAVPPTEPSAPKPMKNAIFAFVVSLMLAIAAAFGLEALARKFDSVEAVEEVIDFPVLTEVPKVDTPAPVSEGGLGIESHLHEPFHRLQMNLDMLSKERPLRTILIASAAPGEGKSMVTRNLALAHREAGHNVAVLDADFRKATLGGLLHAHEGPGLTDILAGRASFGQAVQEVAVLPDQNGNGTARTMAGAMQDVPPTVPTQGELAIVPAGPHSASLAASLTSGGMQQTLKAAVSTYDRVLIDSSPLLAAADVLPLLSEVDGVLLVTRLGVTSRDSAKRLVAELRRVSNINVIGVVVNGIPSRIYRTRAYGYYYG